jgi:polyribonucleotide nucleotidyltransferase
LGSHSQALAQAAAGRAHILQQMGRCDPPPTRALSKWAPKVLALSIPPDKMGQLIGPVRVGVHVACRVRRGTGCR